MKKFFAWRSESLVAVITIMCLFVVTACGGGSSGDSAEPSTPGPQAVTLSGTVAAGAPLVGYIAARDSNDNIVSAEVSGNGKYTLDITDLVPPYLLYASGISGGTAYIILSAATADDADGNVNVTPLTDLIVANVAGMNPTEFFNDPDFSLLTRAALDASEASLRERLLPLFIAAGVTTEFNLLTTPFDADRTQIDAALDMIEVTVSGAEATIRHRITGDQITDDLTVADNTILEFDAQSMTIAIFANLDIAARLNALAGLIANGVPSAEQAGAFFTDGFLMNGCDRVCLVEFIEEAAQDAFVADDLADFFTSFPRYSLVETDLEGEIGTRWVTIDIGDSSGPLLLEHQLDGTWLIAGNGRTWLAEVFQEHHRHVGVGDSNVRTELNFLAEYEEAGSGDYIVVTGPGLPGGEYTLRQFFLSDESNEPTPGEFFGGVTLTDEEIAAIPRRAEYTFTRYDADDQQLDAYAAYLTMEPIKASDAVAFPTIVTPTPAQVAAFSSGNLTVEWTLPTGYSSNSVALDRFEGGQHKRIAEEFVGGDVTGLVLEDIEQILSSDIEWQNVMVFTRDVFGRYVVMTHGASF